MLMRMYMRWAESNGYKLSVANLQEGDEAGIKTVTMNIEGSYAYGYLKGENGVHRLVRVSPYNAQGKRMTSFASVFVTPLVDDSIEVTVEPARLSWDTFRSGGAGGQNVNKVESGVRLRYQYKDPYTGEEEEILIENTETRDQPKNKENAMRQLRSILYDKELQHRMEEQAKVEAGKKKIEWGSQIRSYVFDDRRVKDHRTNYQTSDDVRLSGKAFHLPVGKRQRGMLEKHSVRRSADAVRRLTHHALGHDAESNMRSGNIPRLHGVAEGVEPVADGQYKFVLIVLRDAHAQQSPFHLLEGLRLRHAPQKPGMGGNRRGKVNMAFVTIKKLLHTRTREFNEPSTSGSFFP